MRVIRLLLALPFVLLALALFAVSVAVDLLGVTAMALCALIKGDAA